MPQLIRIGNTIINLAYVLNIEIEGEGLISVQMAVRNDVTTIQFQGKDAATLRGILDNGRFVYNPDGYADLTAAVVG